MIVVIDTNCLLASIPPQRSYYWFYEAFRAERFVWAVSNEILFEYEEKLSTKYSPKTATLVLSILSVAPNVIFQEPYFKWRLIRSDPDDDKFVDLAFFCNADYVITNDKDFSCLKDIDFPKLNVISLDDFRKVIIGG